MPILHAIILGITQGLAEFLPISSSGHLKLVPWLFGWNDFGARPEFESIFDVALHMGTLIGAIAYFRSDLISLARAGVGALVNGRSKKEVSATTETSVRPATVDVVEHPNRENEARLAWLLLLSVIPAAVMGALFEDYFAKIGEAEWAIGLLLIVFGLVLLWADRLGGDRSADDFRWRDALLMGGAQALALQPGVSRSGVTITMARKIGFQRDSAARLSFLMSLPVIAGAGIFKGLDIISAGGIPTDMRAAFLAGVITSGITGWIAVWGTLRLVRTRTFAPFVVYRVIVGVGVLVIAASSFR